MRQRIICACLGLVVCTGGQLAAQADNSKLKPLPELGTAEYHGFQGGLYPGGNNERPEQHEAAGQKLAAQVQPLDATGRLRPDGKVVLLGVGMSNTSQAFSAFKQVA